MRYRRGLQASILLLLIMLAQTPALAAGEMAIAGGPAITNSPPDVDFKWAFAVLSSSPDGKATVQPITRDMALKSGDQLKMMVELQRKCFVYVFHYNPRDGLKMLFPYSLQQLDGDYQAGRRYFIPRSEAWFRLDANPGQESFYLVAAAQRLDDLERDYRAFENSGAGEKSRTALAVVERIKTLRREHREFALPAEKPVSIGGALRGVLPGQAPSQVDISALADEITSNGFMARTYTIDHQ
ncbi:MAG: DUF4384 domain-containing protein [Syntrophobacter sp.]